MSEWKSYLLGDFAELRKEQIVSNGVEQPYIGLEHIEQQSLRLNSIGSSDSVVSTKFKFYNGDVLYGRLRPYFRKVYNPKFEGVCSTEIFVIKNKKNVDKDFLYYLVATEEFTNIANSGSSGTHMPRADWKQLEKSEWNIPDLSTQTAIAQILTSLDDKIELNLQMNQTLEAMAQAIFKEWFVSEANENWQTIQLGKLIEIKGGFSYEAKYIGEGDALLLGMGCVSFSERFLLTGARPYSGECGINHLVIPGDIVIATRQQSDNLPILGFPASVPITLEGKKIIVGANLYKVFNNSVLSNSILFQLFKSDGYKNHILTNSKGSTVRMITKDAIELYDMKLPPIEIIRKCDILLQAIDNKLEINKAEIQTITATRDTLLPILMSGKLEIKA